MIGAEPKEVPIRQPNSLSPRDAVLPVGQNIFRAYQHTPELQQLGAAIASENSSLLTLAINQSAQSIQENYDLRLVIIPDSLMLLKTIFMSKSLEDDPLQMALELAHEIGAARLIKIYGSKKKLPRGLPDPGGDQNTYAATHYLDWFTHTQGQDQRLITMARNHGQAK
jgi:hypothetical protein